MNESITESGNVQIIAEADILVVGGGPSGVCAAISAAREGSKVILLERGSFLGGTATAGLMAGFMGFYWGAEVPVTGGIPREIIDRLEKQRGGSGFLTYTLGELTHNPVDSVVYPFDPEVLKFVLDDVVQEAGVQVVNHALAAKVFHENGEPAGVIYQGVTKRRAIRAGRIIDATGDGVMAAGAGAPLTEDSATAERQPMTLLMRVTGIDPNEMRALPKIERQKIVQNGIREEKLFYSTLAMYPCPFSRDFFMLLTAVNGYDALDEFELTGGAQEGRRQAQVSLEYLRANMPGFKSAQLIQTASWMGIRETQRVKGLYQLTADDVLNGKEFGDAISWGGGPLDTHVGDGVVLESPSAPFSTPYRCLVPEGVSNMLVVGRAASSTHEAMSALRHMGALMPLGEAAGVAAVKSLNDCVPVDEIDVQALRTTLRARGAVVDRPVLRGDLV